MGDDYQKYGFDLATWTVRLSRAKTGSLLSVYAPDEIGSMLTEVGLNPTKDATMLALDLVGRWIDDEFYGWNIIDIIPVV